MLASLFLFIFPALSTLLWMTRLDLDHDCTGSFPYSTFILCCARASLDLVCGCASPNYEAFLLLCAPLQGGQQQDEEQQQQEDKGGKEDKPQKKQDKKKEEAAAQQEEASNVLVFVGLRACWSELTTPGAVHDPPLSLTSCCRVPRARRREVTWMKARRRRRTRGPMSTTRMTSMGESKYGWVSNPE